MAQAAQSARLLKTQTTYFVRLEWQAQRFLTPEEKEHLLLFQSRARGQVIPELVVRLSGNVGVYGKGKRLVNGVWITPGSDECVWRGQIYTPEMKQKGYEEAFEKGVRASDIKPISIAKATKDSQLLNTNSGKVKLGGRLVIPGSNQRVHNKTVYVPGNPGYEEAGVVGLKASDISESNPPPSPVVYAPQQKPSGSKNIPTSSHP